MLNVNPSPHSRETELTISWEQVVVQSGWNFNILETDDALLDRPAFQNVEARLFRQDLCLWLRVLNLNHLWLDIGPDMLDDLGSRLLD